MDFSILRGNFLNKGLKLGINVPVVGIFEVNFVYRLGDALGNARCNKNRNYNCYRQDNNGLIKQINDKRCGIISSAENLKLAIFCLNGFEGIILLMLSHFVNYFSLFIGYFYSCNFFILNILDCFNQIITNSSPNFVWFNHRIREKGVK